MKLKSAFLHAIGVLMWELLHMVSMILDLMANLPLPSGVAMFLGREQRFVQTPQGTARGARVPHWRPRVRALFDMLGWASPHNAEDVTCYEGIPFATLSHRFAAPTPLPDAKTEAEKATVLNPIHWWKSGYKMGTSAATAPQRAAPAASDSPQVFNALPVALSWLFKGYYGSELDSLQLNVWVPEGAKKRAAKGELLPVLVFIHGGVFIFGSAHLKLMRGERISRRGIIMVSVNSRLGLPGYLNVPGCPSNRGLRDLLEALRWVKKNIKSFGGDPSHVTVSGYSSGAMSAAMLMGVPAVYDEKLVSAVSLLSGYAHMAMSREEANSVTTDVRNYLTRRKQLSPDASDEELGQLLQSMTMSEFMGIQMAMELKWINRENLSKRPYRWIPVSPHFGDTVDADGGILPEHPVVFLQRRLKNKQWVPRLMLGVCDQEYAIITVGGNSLIPLTPTIDQTKIGEKIEFWFSRVPEAHLPDADKRIQKVVKAYQEGDLVSRHTDSRFPLWNAVNSDWNFRVPAEHLASSYRDAGHDVFFYRFDEHSALPMFGPTHIVDLHLFFGNIGNSPYLSNAFELTRATKLSGAMQHALVSFVKARKSADVQSAVGWEPFDKRRGCLVFGGDDDSPVQHMEFNADEAELASWGDAMNRWLDSASNSYLPKQ